MASEIGTSFGDLKRSRSVHMVQLTKLYKDLEKNMISYDNEERVKQLYEKLCERFEQFKASHSLCLDACTQPEVRESLEASLTAVNRTLVNSENDSPSGVRNTGTERRCSMLRVRLSATHAVQLSLLRRHGLNFRTPKL